MRPKCYKCTKSKKVCEGYEELQVWLFEPQKSDKAPSPPRFPSIPHRGEEWRSLQFFDEQTKPALVLFNSAAHDFWTMVIPQLSALDCAIRNQVIATASAHEASLRDACDPSVDRLSYKAYSKAMGLIIRSSTPSVHIVLASCLLSIAMGAVKQDYAAAYTHLRSGLAVLREWKAEPVDTREDPEGVIKKYMEPIYGQLAATFGLQHMDASRLLPLAELSWVPPTFPDDFTSVLQAREKFTEIGTHIYMLARKFPNFERYDNPVYRDIIEMWNDWSRPFKKLYPKLFDPREIERWNLMDVFVRLHKITWRCYCSPNEMLWDSYVDECRAQVEICEKLIGTHAMFSSDDSILADPGVAPPLWQVAIGCRDPVVRRRAIALIHLHHRKWGHPDDCFIGMHAQAIVNLEEQGLGDVSCCSDVPESRRIRPVDYDFNTPGVVRSTYTRSPYLVHETFQFPFPSRDLPVVRSFKLFPLSETMRLAGYQLLLRPKARGCRCKSFGGDADD